MSDDFASAAANLSDGGSSIAATLSEPVGTTAPKESSDLRQTPDPDSARSGVAPADSALSSEPIAPAALTPEVLAQARQQFEADPQLKAIIDIRNRFSDGDLAETMPMIEALAKDPRQFAKELIEHLKANGQWDEEAPRQPFALPEPDMASEDGTVKAFSAPAVAKIINDLKAELEGKFDGAMAPILTERQQAEQQKTLEANYSKKLSEVSTQTTRARAILPDFKALEPKIIEAMSADFDKPAHLRSFNGDIYAAYHAVKQANPTSSPDATRQTVIDELRTKAGASPHRTTRATAGGDSRPASSFAELAQRNRGAAETAASSIAR